MSSIPALTLAEITARGIDPALRLLPPKMDTPEARVMLLAIGLQESDFRDRRQLVTVTRNGKRVTVPEGPAKSFWQAEVTGGMVHYVPRHPATKDLAAYLCESRQVAFEDPAIWNAIESDDVLAAGLARLLLYSDAKPLPALGKRLTAWDYYKRNWRPGKPKPEKWPVCYERAMEFLAAGEA
jgi:hypothetical protein